MPVTQITSDHAGVHEATERAFAVLDERCPHLRDDLAALRQAIAGSTPNAADGGAATPYAPESGAYVLKQRIRRTVHEALEEAGETQRLQRAFNAFTFHLMMLPDLPAALPNRRPAQRIA